MPNGPGFAFILLAAIFLLVVLTLLAFGLRRFQLRGALGTLDSSIRMSSGTWRMGIARYTDTHLEWLRLFSLSPLPKFRFLRSSLQLEGWRQPTDAERPRIQPGAIIVRLSYEGEKMLLAMRYDSYTGLSSWLEAGPSVGIGVWR